MKKFSLLNTIINSCLTTLVFGIAILIIAKLLNCDINSVRNDRGFHLIMILTLVISFLRNLIKPYI